MGLLPRHMQPGGARFLGYIIAPGSPRALFTNKRAAVTALVTVLWTLAAAGLFTTFYLMAASKTQLLPFHSTARTAQLSLTQKQQLQRHSAFNHSALQRFVNSSGDSNLAHLVTLSEEAVAAKVSVRVARKLYTSALTHLSEHGVLDLTALNRGIGSGYGRLKGGKTAALARFLVHGLSMLAHQGSGHIVPCTLDPTLPGPPKGRYLLASNLHNSEKIMRNYVLQLLRLVLLLPPGDAYVMVYESGSSDDTVRWLHLLQLLLEPIGVPANITVGGTLVRRTGQERIDYLVEVRNALVTPFFGLNPNATCTTKPQRRAWSSPPSATAATAAACFAPDHIMFINDVFWCLGDAVRLMQHGETDMACGVDVGKFGRIGNDRRRQQRRRRGLLAVGGDGGGDEGAEHMGQQQQQQWQGLGEQQQQEHKQQDEQQQEHKQQDEQQQGWQGQQEEQVEELWEDEVSSNESAGGVMAGGSSSSGDAESKVPDASSSIVSVEGSRGSGRALLTAAADEPQWQYPKLLGERAKPNYGINGVIFYDIWVARDRTGARFKWNAPWATNPKTAAQIRSGLPLPMHCCWNGMVMVNPEPFRRGLRFRTHLAGECMASECSLLCDDMHRMGHSKIIMDPSVRVGYGYAHKWVMSAPGFNYTSVTGLNVTDWAAVAASPTVNWSDPSIGSAYQSVDCCDKLPHAEDVDWRKCHKVDVMKPNYTEAFMHSCLPSIRDGSAGLYTVATNQSVNGMPIEDVLAVCPTG